MVNRFFLYLISVLVTPLASLTVAQAQEEQEGEIEDVEVEIIKEREVTLPRAVRSFEKIPPSPVSPSEKDITFKFKNFTYSGEEPQLKLRPLKLKEDKLPKTYGNLFKAGFGNYLTPYVEAFVNNKRDRDYSYGVHFKHLSSGKGPVDGKNSATGESSIDVFGKAFMEGVTLDADIGFSKKVYNFYGYPENAPVDKDTLGQSFGRFHAGGGITGDKEGARLRYHLKAGLDFLSDKFEAKENEFGTSLEGTYGLGEKTDARLATSVAIITRKDRNIDDNRILFKLKPTFGFAYEGFKIRAGLNAIYENDTLGKAGKLHLYPYAKATYPVVEALTVYAGIEGDVDKRTLNTMSEENPFLKADVPIFHTNKTFSFFGGIHGKLNRRLAYHTGFSASNYKNMYFFQNDLKNTAKFDLIYDTGNTGLFNYFAEAVFSENEQLNLTLRGDFYAYSTDNLPEAWHKPRYNLALLATSNIFDKVLLSGDIYLFGGITALNNETKEKETLAAASDINVKVEYLISDQVSAFMSFKNILSSSYQRWNNYPVKKFQGMLGFTYNF